VRRRVEHDSAQSMALKLIEVHDEVFVERAKTAIGIAELFKAGI
jgi:hypothetical protein